MHLTKQKKYLVLVLALVLFSAILVKVINQYRSKVKFYNFTTALEIKEIWKNYHNLSITTDIQVTRSISPYKELNANVVEANQVVTDYDNIYSISNNQVVITNVEKSEITDELSFPFKPLFIYVTNDKLIVIGEADKKTHCFIYNKHSLELYKSFDITSTYITSRLIADELFIVTSKLIESKDEVQERPNYHENQITKPIPYSNIYYINGTYSNNYVNIAKTNINNRVNLDIVSYLGLGQVIYFSDNHIYFAEEKYRKEGSSNQSIIIKFNQDLILSGAQEIKGYVLDQHSLNEYRDNLRVATSSHNDTEKESNNIYILNEKMKIIGKLEDFSRGQEIQAATFIKDKAYVETFNILDPFYVISLANERKPKIISSIKFDGYNTNLIPYDENHIVAFGLILDQDKHATGLKVSLYDVTNPNKVNIKAKATFMYDEYNSAYSDVLYDCKALLLDYKRGYLGFPIIYWINEKQQPAYYKQFYVVYKINDGFTQLGKISHYENSKSMNGSNDIKRGIIINQSLYTVSDRLIKENALDGLELVNEIKLK